MRSSARWRTTAGRRPTHALLPGSPALDAGDTAAAATAGLTHRSARRAFARVRDAADADTTATVDIGAVEADPSVEDIADQSTTEETPLSFTFNVGDASTVIDASHRDLQQHDARARIANLSVTGSGSTRTLTITPALNQSGTTTITVTVTKTVTGTRGEHERHVRADGRRR